MNFSRMFLDSVRQRVVSSDTESSINTNQVHRPLLGEDDNFGDDDPCLWSDKDHLWCAVVPYQDDAYKRIPERLWYKKAEANMENYNKQCSKWAVTRALNPVERNPQWITRTLREQTRQYNWTNIDFPTPLSQIELFERNNNVLVNVFGYN